MVLPLAFVKLSRGIRGICMTTHGVSWYYRPLYLTFKFGISSSLSTFNLRVKMFFNLSSYIYPIIHPKNSLQPLLMRVWKFYKKHDSFWLTSNFRCDTAGARRTSVFPSMNLSIVSKHLAQIWIFLKSFWYSYVRIHANVSHGNDKSKITKPKQHLIL